MEVPKIISVDDHVVEPPDLWVERLPARFRDVAPRVETVRAVAHGWTGNGWSFSLADDGDPDAKWADVWRYEGETKFIQRGLSAAGIDHDDLDYLPLTYAEMRPGAYDRDARLADMDANHTDASLCFPTIPRFCGNWFLGRQDVELALACLRTYNDWMIDEWCAGPALGRLIPMTLVPLWDPNLAAAEVRRCAAKGSHAVSFCECPPMIGLPSLYTGHWDPLIAACQETDTVVNMHIGSSSLAPQTSPDAPHMVSPVLVFENSVHALLDWIISGTMARFPDIRIALSESQAGWIPFVLERLDKTWEQNRAIDSEEYRVPEPPSSYVPGRIYACIFDDLHALRARDEVGMSQMMFEVDYPHVDSTWDHTLETVTKLCAAAEMNDAEIAQLVRGNAIACYGLDRYYGIR